MQCLLHDLFCLAGAHCTVLLPENNQLICQLSTYYQRCISLGDIHCAPTRWVLAFFPEFLNFLSDAPKHCSLGGGGV